MKRTPRFKYAHHVYMESKTRPSTNPHYVGLFTNRLLGEAIAQDTFGWRSGRFDTLTGYRSRVPFRLWEELKKKEAVQ